MADLILRETDTGAAIGTLRLHSDDRIESSGLAADVAMSVLESRVRSLGLSRADAFRYIEQWGWSNGPLSLAI